MRLKAVVIGVGKVGSRFDEEKGRRTIWSHSGAYAALPDRYFLAGACDPDTENRAHFAARFPQVPLFSCIDAMLSTVEPQVASICTPPSTHGAILYKLLGTACMQAVWCEKPISLDLSDAEEMQAQVKTRGIPVVVSHVRRWTPLWRRARQLTQDGTLGHVRVIRIAMPNRLWSVGSHAVDLALMLGGSVQDIRPLGLPALEEDGEPAVAALLGFADGAYGIVQVTGLQRGLIVEAEIVGDAGRALVREDRGEVALERFAPSPVYNGYDSLGSVVVERHATLNEESPFLAIAKELASLVSDPRIKPTCDIDDAVDVQRVLAAMAITNQKTVNK